MQKLFYQNSDIKEFISEIVNVKKINNEFHVELDNTAFFPGGGGQPCDLGKIDIYYVKRVYEQEGIIYHVIDENPKRIHKVKCFIDSNLREYSMTHHLAQHVISRLFLNELKRNTVSFHIGNDTSTVDIEGSLSDEDIIKIEKMVNDIINLNLKVNMKSLDKKEAKKLKIDKNLIKSNSEIRIVEIEDFDLNCCCGVHSKSTLDLRIVKFKKWEKYKQSTRIEYLAGAKCVDFIMNRESNLTKICKYLSCGDDDAIKGIENMNQKLSEAIKENKKLKEEISKYEVEDMISSSIKIGDINIITKIYDNNDMKYINNISNKITKNDDMVTLFAAVDKENAKLLFACSDNLDKLDMNLLLKDAIKLIDGRGGGNKKLAQGGGKNNSNLDSLMKYCIMKLEKGL